MMNNKVVIRILAVCILAMLLPSYKAQAGNNLPVLHFQAIHDAIVNGDAEGFASLVKYPIVRDYPLKNIEDSAEMVAYFPTLIDDSLRKAYKEVKPTDWEGGGWQGYTDGYFWDEGDRIYSIVYYSQAELTLKSKLEKKEIASLHPSLRGGNVEPYACLYDASTHAILRIDRIITGEEADNSYRVCIYNNVRKLHKKPDIILKATSDIDGTAGIQWFECYKEDGKNRIHVLDFALDYTDNPDGFEADVLVGKNQGKHLLHPIYWLDLVE